MIDRLAAIDVAVFQAINGRLTLPVLDVVMRAVTDQSNWYPVLGALWIALLIWGGRRGRLAAVALLVAIGIADQTSISLLKPLVGRIRPCNALPPDQVRLLVRCSKAFSFPSAHAANSFAMATVIAWRFPRIAALGFAVAFVVAYSRVYVGVHYPLDAIGGAVVGLVAGRLAVWIVVRISSALRARRPLSAS